MRWYLVAIFAFLLTVIQTSLFVPGQLAFRMFDVYARPDLLLLLALAVALCADPWEVFVTAWALGLVEDLGFLSDRSPLGITALLFAVVAWAVSRIRDSLTTEHLRTQIVLAVLMVVCVRFPQQLLVFWLGPSNPGAFHAVKQTLGDAVYSALLAPLLVWILVKTVSKRGVLRSR
jgi:rod shape-determining protein MreD